MKISAIIISSFFLCLPCVFGQNQESFVNTADTKLAQLEKLHAKAEECVIENKFKEALETYSEILLIEPDDETAYANSGHVQMILGNFDEAQECFWNALDINPENLTALEGLKQIENPDYLQKPKIAEPAPEPAVPETPLGPDTAIATTVAPPPATPVPPAPVVATPAPITTVNAPPIAAPALSREEEIQSALKNAGLYHGIIDGKIGPVSIRAIRTFQKFRGLDVDGKVGPKTWKALEPYLKIKQQE